jgi:hypothetical protein
MYSFLAHPSEARELQMQCVITKKLKISAKAELTNKKGTLRPLDQLLTRCNWSR